MIVEMDVRVYKNLFVFQLKKYVKIFYRLFFFYNLFYLKKTRKKLVKTGTLKYK